MKKKTKDLSQAEVEYIDVTLTDRLLTVIERIVIECQKLKQDVDALNKRLTKLEKKKSNGKA